MTNKCQTYDLPVTDLYITELQPVFTQLQCRACKLPVHRGQCDLHENIFAHDTGITDCHVLLMHVPDPDDEQTGIENTGESMIVVDLDHFTQTRRPYHRFKWTTITCIYRRKFTAACDVIAPRFSFHPQPFHRTAQWPLRETNSQEVLARQPHRALIIQL